MRNVSPLPILALLSVLPLSSCSDGPGDSAGTGGERGLRIGVVLPPGDAGSGYRQGVELGAEEARRSAELIGTSFEILQREAGNARAAAIAARALADEGAFAIIGGAGGEVCRALGAAAADEGILFVNVGCREDDLRTDVLPSTFHVQASEWMYAEAAAASEMPGDAAVLWHPDLVRYGAAQLNERFQRRLGEPPAEGAWAGWMAVKVLWEAAVRVGSTDADALARYLLDENTSFDGHKGQALAFGPEDHQLHQPLYRPTSVGGSSIPIEVDPVTGSAAGWTSAEWQALEGRPVPPGRYVLVSNEGSGDVVVIDDASGEIASRIRVGARPRGIRVSADGRLVYVALSDQAPTVQSEQDGIAVIDLREGRVVDHYSSGSDPEQFALTPGGRFLISANEDAGTATVTAVPGGEALATLAVGIEPEGVAASPDGRWVYVTAETSNTVSVIDVAAHDVVANFMVDVRPRAAAFSPTAPRAYVTNEISGTLSVVDTESHSVTDTFEIPNEAATPVGVVVSPDGNRIYVASGHGNSVSVIDAHRLEQIAEVPVGRRPWGIDVSPDGRRIYTANGLTNDVSVIDAESLEVVRTIPVGNRPWGVVVTP